VSKIKVLIAALTMHGVHSVVTEFDTIEEAVLACSRVSGVKRGGWDNVHTATILNPPESYLTREREANKRFQEMNRHYDEY
jgi:hypothetical protein